MKFRMMCLVADVLSWFLLGACLARLPLQFNQESRETMSVVALPADLCKLVPEAVRQEMVAANSAGLYGLAEYDLRLLATQATDCN